MRFITKGTKNLNISKKQKKRKTRARQAADYISAEKRGAATVLSVYENILTNNAPPDLKIKAPTSPNVSARM